MAAIEPISKLRCWICGNEVSLEICKTDENGHAVHEPCYTVRMHLQAESWSAPKMPAGD